MPELETIEIPVRASSAETYEALKDAEEDLENVDIDDQIGRQVENVIDQLKQQITGGQ